MNCLLPCSCPPALMKTQFHSSSTSDPCHNSLNGSPQSATVLPGSRLGERIDSTYGTDSNRTITPQDIKNENGTFPLTKYNDF